jgi:hypothetical protein
MAKFITTAVRTLNSTTTIKFRVRQFVAGNMKRTSMGIQVRSVEAKQTRPAAARGRLCAESEVMDNEGECYVTFEVFPPVTMTNAVFCDIKTQFAPHRKHYTSVKVPSRLILSKKNGVFWDVTQCGSC